MKTAEEYWDGLLASKTVFGYFRSLNPTIRQAILDMVAAIAADARAEAASPDAEEEREFQRFKEFCKQEMGACAPSMLAGYPGLKNVVEKYAATFPPRPMRSPGQRLWESLVDAGAEQGPWDLVPQFIKNQMEAAATALGIEHKE